MQIPRRTARRETVAALVRTSVTFALLFSASLHHPAAQTYDGREGRRPSGFVEYQAARQTGAPGGGFLTRQELAFALPVARLGAGALAFNGDVRWLSPSSDAVFPESGTEVPGSAAAFKLGVDHTVLYRNGWISRVGVSLLASSVPWTEGGTGMAASGLLRVPVGESAARQPRGQDAWRFIIAYAPTESDFPYPIPLAAYEWRPASSFRMDLGLPFLVSWRPVRSLSLTAMYAPIARIEATAELTVADTPLSVFVGFTNTDETYVIGDAERDATRLHSAATALKTGLRLAVSKRGSLRIGVDYFLERALVLGDRITEDDRIAAEGGFSVNAGYRLRF